MRLTIPEGDHHASAQPAKWVSNYGADGGQFPSFLPPPDAGPLRIGRRGWGRRGTAEAVARPFTHVTSDNRDQMGMGRDPRGDGGATCKIAGIAYTGSNPVPATLALSCGNAVLARLSYVALLPAAGAQTR